MDYMFLIHTDAGAVPLDPATEGFDEMMSAWWVYNRMLVDGGHFVSGGSLRPADTATTVSTSTGAVTDGPFVETKEDIGGFYVVRADDLDQALELARAIPVPASVEVRPLMYRPDA